MTVPRGFRIFSQFSFVFLLSSFVLAGSAVLFMRRHADRKRDFVGRYQNQGYELREESEIIVREVTSGPVVLYNTSPVKPLSINSNINGNVAIAAQSIVIAGRIKGDVDFFSSRLHVLKSAHIEGDIRSAFPAEVIIDGDVRGEITGKIRISRSELNANDDAKPNAPDDAKQPAQKRTPPVEAEAPDNKSDDGPAANQPGTSLAPDGA